MLNITPEVVRQTYSLLNSTLPFRKWNLPEPDDVIFFVSKDRTLSGWYCINRRGKRPKHELAVSIARVGTLYTLCEVVAHEMVHLHQSINKMDRHRHGVCFRKLADEVCASLGFDVKAF